MISGNSRNVISFPMCLETIIKINTRKREFQEFTRDMSTLNSRNWICLGCSFQYFL